MFPRKTHVAMTSAALLALSTLSIPAFAEQAPAADAAAHESGANPAAATPAADEAAAEAAADAAIEAAREASKKPQKAEAVDQAAASAVSAESPAAAAALNGNPAATAEAAASTEAVSATASAADGPLIDSKGVRGDVVLSMLDQRACSGNTVGKMTMVSRIENPPGMPNGFLVSYPHVEADEQNDDNYQELQPNSKFSSFAPCSDNFFRYVPAAPGDHTITEVSELDWIFHGYRKLTSMHRFNKWTAKVPLNVTADSFSLGTSVTGKAELDTHNGGDAPHVGEDQTLQLNADRPFSTRLDARIPYGVLSVWKDAQGSNYQLLLLPGETGQARLCWNTNASIVKRLTCTTWIAPDDWARGKKLNAISQYVIDDRTAYGEEGLIRFGAN